MAKQEDTLERMVKCVNCDNDIDLQADTYEVGVSLGEYWCDDCVDDTITNPKITNKQKKAIWEIYADAHDRIGFSDADFAIKQAEMITITRITEILGEDIKFKSTQIPDTKSFIESIDDVDGNFNHIRLDEETDETWD